MSLDKNKALYVGIDVHRYEHAAVAANRFEEEMGSLSFANTPEGIKVFLAWLKKVAQPNQTCIIGMEGANGNGRQLCSLLMPRYQEIYEINPIQTKQRRDHHTSRDKSDPIDARLIIEVLTRKLERLPKITLQDQSRTSNDLEQLVGFHNDLTRQRTRLKNQLHQLFHQEKPNYHLLKGLPFSQKSLGKWYRQADYQRQRYQRVSGLIIKEKIKHLKQLNKVRQEIDQRMKIILEQSKNKNLLTLPGSAEITAAKIITAVRGIDRFRNIDAFVKYTGIAPIAKSSGKSKKHRQNKTGNRQLNTAIYTIALTQMRCLPEAKEYFEKKIKEGKSKKHALRCLMKRAACIVYGMLKNGEDYRA